MTREAADRWCERGILALVLAILAFAPVATGAVLPWEFLLVRVLTLGVLVLWAARLWLQPRPQLLWPPICWPVLAFTAYALARYLSADVEYVARQEWLRILVYAFLFLAILSNLHGQDETQLASLTLIFLAMAICFYAVYQFMTDSDKVWGMVTRFKHRGAGTYFCPNHLAGLLELLLPLTLAYLLAGRFKPVAKVLLGYAALVMVAGLGATVSRGAWASVGLALMVLFGALLLRHQHRLPALVLLVALGLTVAVALPRSLTVRQRLDQLVSSTGKVDDDMRFALWGPALQMWEANFWWGVGPAHYIRRFGMYRPEVVQLNFELAHNDYLNTLADYGLAGGLLVVAALACLGLGVVKTWRTVRGPPNALGKANGSNKFAFVLGTSLGLLAILFHSVIDFNLHIPANALVVVALMAWLSACLRFVTDRYWVTLGWWTKGLASALLLAGLVYLGKENWRQAKECLWLARADRAADFSPEQISLLSRAYAAEPKNPDTPFLIGEAYRRESWAGGADYTALADQAMVWFQRSMELDPWDARSRLRYGMCLDWVGRTADSAPYFDRADELDPNNYFSLANIGWHYVNLGDYAGAQRWLERSLRLQWQENPIGLNYLQVAQSRLLEAATNAAASSLYLRP